MSRLISRANLGTIIPQAGFATVDAEEVKGRTFEFVKVFTYGEGRTTTDVDDETLNSDEASDISRAVVQWRDMSSSRLFNINIRAFINLKYYDKAGGTDARAKTAYEKMMKAAGNESDTLTPLFKKLEEDNKLTPELGLMLPAKIKILHVADRLVKKSDGTEVKAYPSVCYSKFQAAYTTRMLADGANNDKVMSSLFADSSIMQGLTATERHPDYMERPCQKELVIVEAQ
jgi:hypothetical protein